MGIVYVVMLLWICVYDLLAMRILRWDDRFDFEILVIFMICDWDWELLEGSLENMFFVFFLNKMI